MEADGPTGLQLDLRWARPFPRVVASCTPPPTVVPAILHTVILQADESRSASIGTLSPSWYRESGRSLAYGAAVVVLGAALVGGLTPFAQQYLPNWLNSLSNSSGGWTLPAFLLVWLSRARPVFAALLGVVAFEVLVEAYAVVSDLRGYFFAAPFSSRWAIVGLLAGPVIGPAASLTRYGTPLWRVLGVTVPAAVLVGEGAWALFNVADTTSPVYWVGEIVGGAIMIAVALVRHRIGWRRAVVALSVWLAGAAIFFALLTVLSG